MWHDVSGLEGTHVSLFNSKWTGIALASLPVSAGVLVWFSSGLHVAAKAATTMVLLLLSGLVGFGRKVYSALEDKYVKRAADKAEDWITTTTSDFRKDYLNYARSVHHDVDLKGLVTIGNYNLSIDQVFVDLSLSVEPLHRAQGAVIRPKVHDSKTLREPHMSVERRSVWHFMQTEEGRGARLAIIGPPGAGKTTLLKHLVGTLASNNGREGFKKHIPILLYLREHADRVIKDEQISLANLIRADLSLLDSAEPPRWFEEQLDQGQCVVMLDGLDEIASREHRGRVTNWLDRQMDRYSKCTWIVNSRPQGYRSRPLASATVVQVRPFTETQIAQFLAGWYSATHIRMSGRDDVGVRLRAEQESAHLIGKLTETTALLDLASNPLLLTMIAHVHFYRRALPGSRAELYKEMCQVLLGELCKTHLEEVEPDCCAE